MSVDTGVEVSGGVGQCRGRVTRSVEPGLNEQHAEARLAAAREASAVGEEARRAGD